MNHRVEGRGPAGLGFAWLLGAMAVAGLAAGCAEHVPGVRVDFEAGLEAGNTPVDGPLRLQDGTGRDVRLQRAVVVLERLELVPCDAAADAGSETAWLSRWLGVPVARAHGTGSPTRLAVPHVVDLAGPGPWPLGRLEPPADRYCALEVTLGPADEDAEGLSDAAAALGRSLWLQGRMLDAAGGEQPFDIVSGRRVSRRLPLPGGGLRLDAERLTARLTLRFAPADWLADVDLADGDPAERSRAVLQAVLASLRLDVR